MTSTLTEFFDENSFYSQFCSDLRAARALVIMQSPYLTSHKIKRYQYEIHRCIARGVRVCSIVREPSAWRASAAELESLKASIDLLRSYGAHVSLREHAHQKLYVIDDYIIWTGSLNALSHRDSFEHMERWVNPAVVKALIAKHKLDFCQECTKRLSLPLLPGGEIDFQLQFIGKCIARRRRELGLSQSGLARASGATQKSISLLEQGKRDVGLHSVCRIAQALDIRVLPLPWYAARSSYERVGWDFSAENGAWQYTVLPSQNSILGIINNPVKL